MRRATAILLGFFVSACASGAGPVRAQDPASAPPREALRTLDVSAQASVTRPPDRATIRLGVETAAPTAREATQGNAEAMAGVVAALRELGIPESAIRTEALSLSPRYERGGEEPRIIGYQASNQLSVRVNAVDGLGGVVDRAIEAGANRVLGIQFEIADPETAYHQALEQAVAKARREADVLARAMGETLGAPIRVSTGGGPTPGGPGLMPEMMRAQAADTPVQPGELEVRAVVHITYRLGP